MIILMDHLSLKMCGIPISVFVPPWLSWIMIMDRIETQRKICRHYRESFKPPHGPSINDCTYKFDPISVFSLPKDQPYSFGLCKWFPKCVWMFLGIGRKRCDFQTQTLVGRREAACHLMFQTQSSQPANDRLIRCLLNWWMLPRQHYLQLPFK